MLYIMNTFRYLFLIKVLLAVTSFSLLAQPAALRIDGITLDSQVPRLTIRGQIGTTNVIEYEDESASRQWWALTNLVVTNNPYVYVDPSAPPSPQRFYRVLVPGPDYVPRTRKAPAGMVLIPGGWFTLGDTFNEGAPGERPAHPVSVSPFYLDQYEVTQALWDEVHQWAITNGYGFIQSAFALGTNYPIRSVSWYDMAKWCNARSEKEGVVPAYYTDAAQTTVYRDGWVDLQNGWVKWNAGYRLPTNAEWEKAARGGLEGKRYPWGDTIEQSLANYEGLWDYSMTPVGSFAPNGYGLYDIAGNIWEWCWDWYEPYASSDPQIDPRGPNNPSGAKNGRVMRGGSWYSLSFYLRCAYHGENAPSGGNVNFGFRAARGL